MRQSSVQSARGTTSVISKLSAPRSPATTNRQQPSRPGAIHTHLEGHYKTLCLQLTPLVLLRIHTLFIRYDTTHLIPNYGQHNGYKRQRDSEAAGYNSRANRALEERYSASIYAHSPHTRPLRLRVQVPRSRRRPRLDAAQHPCTARRAADSLCSRMPSTNRWNSFDAETEAWREEGQGADQAGTRGQLDNCCTCLTLAWQLCRRLARELLSDDQKLTCSSRLFCPSF